MFSGTSDNEPRAALGVGEYINYSDPVRFVCHSLTLAVKDSLSPGYFSQLLWK